MPDQLAEWEAQLAELVAGARRDLEPLSAEQFNWRPGPGRWSVGKCLNHLAITTTQVLERVRPALERARAEGRSGEPPFRYGAVGGWFVRTMEAPGKRPMPSPSNFVPPSGVPKDQVLAAFQASQEKLRNSILASRGLPLDRIRAPSAARGAAWLRLRASAWFAATLAHERRHLAQARRVTATPGFPASS